MRYIFGPIISRRLGVSLGVDLVSYKICSLNCIYCECGRTRLLTKERREYNNINEIIKELDEFLKNKPIIDYITLTGEGEPTLNSEIKRLITYLKKNYSNYKVAILTNSTLLNDKQVQEDIIEADLIVPSFDAYSQDIFEKINRPCIEIKNEDIINGLIEFSHKFKGKIWIEIFIVPGVNDKLDEILKIKSFLEKVKFEEIQLNSLDRTPAESDVKKADNETLERIKKLLYPLNVKIVKFLKTKNVKKRIKLTEENLLNILKRRPCTLDDFIEIFDSPIEDIKRIIDLLIKYNKISIQKLERGFFYKLNRS